MVSSSSEDSTSTCSGSVSSPSPCQFATFQPPVAKQVLHEHEMHGDIREDSYHWIRDDDRTDSEVLKLLESENRYASARMQHMEPVRGLLVKEMKNRIEVEDSEAPVKSGNYFYYAVTEKEAEYKKHVRRQILEPDFKLRANSTMENVECGKEELLLDENVLALGKEFCSVHQVEVSPDHNLIAWLVDYTGAEDFTLQIKNIATDAIIEESITEEAGMDIVWSRDSRTIFYILQDDAKRPYKVMRHTIGEEEPVLVYEEEDPTLMVDLLKCKSGRYGLIKSWSETMVEINAVNLERLDDKPVTLISRKMGVRYEADETHGNMYLIVADSHDSVNGKLVRYDLDQDDEDKEAIVEIPHSPKVKMVGISCYADFLVLSVRKNGLATIIVHNVNGDGSLGKEIDLGLNDANLELYCILPIPMEFNTSIVRYSYESFTLPKSIYDFDVTSNEKQLKHKPTVPGFIERDYIVERVWVPIKHDTETEPVEVPVSLTYKRSLKVTPGDKNNMGKIGNPMLLMGYGAYDSSEEPEFNSNLISLLDRGMVYGIAHIRGGGEMGRHWYEQGILLNKKNTVTDFIACAKYLIDQGYTEADTVCIRGESAGGITVGAAINLEGDKICAGAIAAVPFLDVLTSMCDESLPLTVIEYSEWGDPNDSKFYHYMKSYSPVDNINTDVGYPRVFATSGLNDPRVGYWEPAKWVQKLRQVGNADVIFRCDMAAGHNSVSGRFDALNEVAFEYAFILDVLQVLDSSTGYVMPTSDDTYDYGSPDYDDSYMTSDPVVG